MKPAKTAQKPNLQGSHLAQFKLPNNLADKQETNPKQDHIPSSFHKAHDYLKENKKKINNWTHISSAAVNIFTFLNGNFRFLNIEDEIQERIGNFFARCTTAVRGLTGAIDCLGKNNLIPFIGNVLEIPTAVFASGYNLWLARGIPQSIRQVQGVIKRSGMKIKDINGKEVPLSEEDGDHFKKYGIGMKDGFLYSVKELGKILKDTFTDPFKKEQFFSRSVLLCSLFQLGGAVTAFSGLKKIGAFFRDLGGALIDGAYMQDPAYRTGGALWIGSAICDYGKLFSFFSDKINNITQLSLAFDALAAIFESKANFGPEDERQTKVIPSEKLKEKIEPADYEPCYGSKA